MHCSNATFLIISLLILSPLNISLSLGHQIGMVKPLKHTGQNIGVFWIAIVISEYTSCFRLFFFLKSSLKLCKFCRMDHCWYQFPFLFFVGVHILFFFLLTRKSCSPLLRNMLLTFFLMKYLPTFQWMYIPMFTLYIGLYFVTHRS